MGKILSYFKNNKPIILEVATYNTRAIRFYKRFGFLEDHDMKQAKDENWNVLPSGKRIPVVFMVKGK